MVTKPRKHSAAPGKSPALPRVKPSSNISAWRPKCYMLPDLRCKRTAGLQATLFACEGSRFPESKIGVGCCKGVPAERTRRLDRRWDHRDLRAALESCCQLAYFLSPSSSPSLPSLFFRLFLCVSAVLRPRNAADLRRERGTPERRRQPSSRAGMRAGPPWLTLNTSNSAANAA